MGLFDLIKGDNQNFNKVMQAFASLNLEAIKIIDLFDNSIYNHLLLYGQAKQESRQKVGESEINFSKLFPTLQLSYDLIKKSSYLILNAVQ